MKELKLDDSCLLIDNTRYFEMGVKTYCSIKALLKDNSKILFSAEPFEDADYIILMHVSYLAISYMHIRKGLRFTFCIKDFMQIFYYLPERIYFKC